ncbi:MAG: NHLP bacteriocin export ABC transporter permease/ATPase subunit [Elainellaceae cyanobacterium]
MTTQPTPSDRALELGAGDRQISGHDPLLLTEANAAWIVRSGHISIFAVEVQHGIARGPRQYLFSVGPEETLFGHAIAPEISQLVLLAVPLEPTVVTRVALSEDLPGIPTASTADNAVPDAGSQALSFAELKARIDPWILKLSQLDSLPIPSDDISSASQHYLSLAHDASLHPKANEVLWLKVQNGRVDWLGRSPFPVVPKTGCFPVGHGTWVTARSSVDLFARATAHVKHPIILILGLAQLHCYTMQHLQQVLARKHLLARRQFQQRQSLDQNATEATLRNLSAVLAPEDDRWLQADSALLVAAGAVGRAMGVTIQPPSNGEDFSRLKEPLEAIARASRLRLRRVLLRGNWWQRDSYPIVAFLEGHRPVALIPTRQQKTRYEILDPIGQGLAQGEAVADEASNTALGDDHIDRPASPDRQAVTPAIARSLEPVAYMFYRPLPEDSLNALSLMRFALDGRYRDVIAVVVTGAVATLIGMLVPQATAILIDDAIPYGNRALIGQIGVGLVAAAFGVASFNFAQAIASMRLETVSDASLQAAVWDRLLRLRATFFREYSTGDLSGRVSAVGAIRRQLSDTALQSIFSGVFALLNLGLLLYYSPQLALLALSVALVVVLFTTVTGALLIRKHRPLMEIAGELNGLVIQLINGVPKLRLAGAETRAFAHWGEKYRQQLRLTLSTQQLEDGVDVVNTMLPVLTTVLLFWIASSLIDDGGLSTGVFLAFSVAYGTFISGALSLSNSIIDILDIIPLWQRSQPILNAKPEVNSYNADPGKLQGRVALDHVTFRYRDDGPLILDDVLVEAQPGEFIALVGPSGSGKSTAFRLMLGFEDPQSGTVTYDGQDLCGLDVTAVRRQLGVVLQNGRISAGTIFENISTGALITMDDAWRAAEMSGLAEDVQTMPMGLHTVVSEGGGNLSGGQRQRLMIARALALEPRVLLMDEATSALDNRTQAIVSQSLDQLQVTRIVIAHRLSTIRNADRIYVLEAGRVVQQGSFEALVAQEGLFAQLIKRQIA